MKKSLLIFPFALLSLYIQAQVAGPFSGTSFTNVSVSGSSRGWADVGNAGASDNVYAIFGNLSNSVGSYTDYLVVKGFNFSLPISATITGIKVAIERADVNLKTADYSVRIVKGGVIRNSEHSTGAAYSQTSSFAIKDANVEYGSANDLWGESWTASAINDAEFGIAVAAQRSQNGGITQGRIDNITLTVYYSAIITLPVKLTRFTATPKNDSHVQLAWTTAEELDMDRFEVQRSADATDFSSIGTVICHNQRSLTEYSLTDYNPSQGKIFYRLKMLERDGKITYSKTVSVDLNAGNQMQLYPSPWKIGTALQIRNAGNQDLVVQFYDHKGDLVARVNTNSGEVPATKLVSTQGILRYTITDSHNRLTGKGSLVAY